METGLHDAFCLSKTSGFVSAQPCTKLVFCGRNAAVVHLGENCKFDEIVAGLLMFPKLFSLFK